MNEIEEIIDVVTDGLDVAADTNNKKGCLTILILVAITVLILWLWNR